MSRTAINSLLSIGMILYVPYCYADRADSEKPLHLESDQVLIDEIHKTSTFTGNVQLTQGSIFISGEKIVVEQDKDGFKHGTIYGHTATFRQKREGMDEYVEGNGERIEYDTRAEEINLYGQAHIKRGLDDVRGEHIIYNLKTEVFRVSGGTSSGTDTPSKRVRAVLQPKKKKAPPPSTPSDPARSPGTTSLPAK